jgi:protocatechuate 3,4-dioxygenase beta subunit
VARTTARALAVGLLALVLAVGLLSCGGEETSTTGTTTATAATESSAGDSTSTTSAGTSGGSGELTVGVTEGPYYITDAPQLANGDLNYAELPGDPIRVSGYVYGGTGDSTPLAGARVEIWHADDSGSYHPNADGDAADYKPTELALRGYVLADASGFYEFTSIYPGEYPGRCRHIHVRASAEGYGSIVTQMIVPAREGDQTTPEDDQIARALPAANDLVFTVYGGFQDAGFDFHLAGD